MTWKDQTSYRRGERGQVEPKTWVAKFGSIEVTVTRYIGYDDTWVGHCPQLHFNVYELTTDLEESKRTFLKLICDQIDLLVASANLIRKELADE